MKRISYILIALAVLALTSCRKDKNDSRQPLNIDAPPEGYSILSFGTVETEHNYTGKFALIGDPDYVTSGSAYLNEETIDPNNYTLIDEPGYYELEIHDSNGAVNIIKFVIINPERNETEWGLKTWTPKHFNVSNSVQGQLDIIYPLQHIENIKLPVVIYNKESQQIIPDYYTLTNSVNTGKDYIKRGVGSLDLKLNGNYSFDITIADITENINVTHVTPGWTSLPTEISVDVTIPANSFIHITDDISILSGGSLTISQGVIVIIDQGVNIRTEGPIDVQGTRNNPVLFTCSDPDSYWGGIIANGDQADITAKYAFFNQAGYNTGSEYHWGHAQRQAAFYTNEADITLENCYCLDHIGQVLYPVNSDVVLKNILVQRAKTTGQLNLSEITIENCIFTDFPVYSDEFADVDNDALYISHSNAQITGSTFMYTKDDGLDTGGDEGGTITIDSCWFEGTFHEGIAMSSANTAVKYHNIYNSTFTNCGQGIELGFSSPNHQVTVDNCEIYGNLVGVRFGDCYPWQQEGHIDINHSQIVDNYDKDIWNMSRECWCPRLDKMTFSDVQISIPTSQYPDLEVVNE